MNKRVEHIKSITCSAKNNLLLPSVKKSNNLYLAKCLKSLLFIPLKRKKLSFAELVIASMINIYRMNCC